jgi:hypothetical protein
MPQATALHSPPPIRERPSGILYRTRGRHHGPVTRLMSPSDLTEVPKPFVFLDFVDTDSKSLSGFGSEICISETLRGDCVCHVISSVRSLEIVL